MTGTYQSVDNNEDEQHKLGRSPTKAISPQELSLPQKTAAGLTSLEPLFHAIHSLFDERDQLMFDSRRRANELDKLLAPVRNALELIDCDLLLNEALYGRSLSNISTKHKVWPIHQKVLPTVDEEGVLRYIHIMEEPDVFSMGIFVFPPGSKIPLHDHPDMCVLSRLLYGSLRLRSYDVISTPLQNSTIIERFLKRAFSSSSFNETMLNVKMNSETKMSAPAVTALYPLEGNVHEFICDHANENGGGAAVLDILFPPYNFEERDCTFYEQISCEKLRAIEQPSDFHCWNGRFGMLGVLEEDKDVTNE